MTTEIEPKKRDFVLIEREKPRLCYKFGKFEGVVNDGSGVSYIKFEKLYNLIHFSIFGATFPNLVSSLKERIMENSVSSYGFYIPKNAIETVAMGLDNITAYLESHPDQRYRGHADLIRKIAEAQKNEQARGEK